MKRILILLFLIIGFNSYGQKYISGGTIQIQPGIGYTNLQNNYGVYGNVRIYTKGQIDSLLGSFPSVFTNGISISGGIAGLGGSLIKNTLIQLAGYKFELGVQGTTSQAPYLGFNTVRSSTNYNILLTDMANSSFTGNVLSFENDRLSLEHNNGTNGSTLNMDGIDLNMSSNNNSTGNGGYLDLNTAYTYLKFSDPSYNQQQIMMQAGITPIIVTNSNSRGVAYDPSTPLDFGSAVGGTLVDKFHVDSLLTGYAPMGDYETYNNKTGVQSASSVFYPNWNGIATGINNATLQDTTFKTVPNRTIYIYGDSESLEANFLNGAPITYASTQLGLITVNYSVSGRSMQHITGQTNSLIDNISQLQPFIDSVRTPIIYIGLGTNDARSFGLTTDTASFRTDYNRVIDTLHNNLGWPLNRIYVSTPVYGTISYNSITIPNMQSYLLMYSNLVKNIVLVKGIQSTNVADIYSAIAAVGSPALRDGEHFSEGVGVPIATNLIRQTFILNHKYYNTGRQRLTVNGQIITTAPISTNNIYASGLISAQNFEYTGTTKKVQANITDNTILRQMFDAYGNQVYQESFTSEGDAIHASHYSGNNISTSTVPSVAYFNEVNGYNSFTKATRANKITSVGALNFYNLLTGHDNAGFGQGAGLNYTGSESNNLILGDNPGVTGENNTITIAAGSRSASIKYDDSATNVANYILARPNGTTGTATFRAMAIGDLPTSGTPSFSGLNLNGGKVSYGTTNPTLNMFLTYSDGTTNGTSGLGNSGGQLYIMGYGKSGGGLILSGVGHDVTNMTPANASWYINSSNVFNINNNFTLRGTTSGSVTLGVIPIAGSGYNFNLPITPGTAGQVLTSQGGGSTAMTWGSVPLINGTADLTAQTTAGNIATFTVGASTATFDVSGYINVTAIATDVIAAQITYTDENGTAQTITLSNISAIGNNSFSSGKIRCKNGTLITAKTTLTTGLGTITFDTGARIVMY